MKVGVKEASEILKELPCRNASLFSNCTQKLKKQRHTVYYTTKDTSPQYKVVVDTEDLLVKALMNSADNFGKRTFNHENERAKKIRR